MIRVELVRLVLNERSDEQLVLLREVEGPRELPIIIGVFEACAIEASLKEQPRERPLTHDLLINVLTQLDARLAYVIIDDLQEETYFAKLVVSQGGGELTIDARPSDAIALALNEEAPMFVTERVMNTVCSP